MSGYCVKHQAPLQSCRFCVEESYRDHTSGLMDEAFQRGLAKGREEAEREKAGLRGIHEGAVIAMEARIRQLEEALRGLNDAVDAFWNDPERPPIHLMRSSSVREVTAAQDKAHAALRAETAPPAGDNAPDRLRTTQDIVQTWATARRAAIANPTPETFAKLADAEANLMQLSGGSNGLNNLPHST